MKGKIWFMVVVYAAIIFSCFEVLANNVNITTKISKLYTYATHGDDNKTYRGDIIIVTDNLPIGCNGGFWVNKEDAIENPSLISFALSAFHSGSTVVLSGDTTRVWSGSSPTKYCKLRYLSLQR